jgi:5-methylthioadenosine/S-adenosylhomocysteine deaminase
MTTLIRDGLTLLEDGRFQAASIVVDAGKIAGLAAPTTVPAEWDIIDASSMIVLPGLINGHTHSYANLSRGLGGNLPLEYFALEGAWAAANRTDDEQYLSAMLGCIEMLKQGVTTALDQPGQDPRGASNAARAYVDAGMRAVVAPMVWDRPYHRWLPWDLRNIDPALWKELEQLPSPSTAEMLDIAASFADSWEDKSGRVRAGVGPFAPGRCSDRLLSGCADISAAHDIPLHTHLVETRLQAVQASREYGRPMVDHLDGLGVLGETFSGAHGVWLSHAEIDLLAERRASVVHNPVSNMTLGSGMAPVRAMVDAGVNVSLGSDGANCGGQQSVFAAMKAAVTMPRLFERNHDQWLDAPLALRMATSNGARTLHDSSLGVIGLGMAADLVLVSQDTTYLSPLNDPSEQLVHAENGCDVHTVIVAGEVVVRGGRLTLVDEDAFIREARDVMGSLLARNTKERRSSRRMSQALDAAWEALRGGESSSETDPL